ncbi:MAG: late competence development ComFB family protein [Treponema sp.]|nr:late competence development ComFB family protein [Treponema sp.]
MKVHNIMEEIVCQHINAIYDLLAETNSSWLTCDCENCRFDATSYVLNRIPPKYVVSGRGVTHSISLIENDFQLKADIDALCNEGIRLISSTKRPFHSLPRKDCEVATPKIPVFNFPTLTGVILDGMTFEPIVGAKVLLKCDGVEAEMVDKTWANPAKTYQSTKGTYSFWMRPVPAEREGISKKVNFNIEVSAQDYDPIIYSLEVPLVSEASVKTELDSTYALKVRDLFMFKKSVHNEME